MKTHRDLKRVVKTFFLMHLSLFHENPQGFETFYIKEKLTFLHYFMKTHRDLKHFLFFETNQKTGYFMKTHRDLKHEDNTLTIHGSKGISWKPTGIWNLLQISLKGFKIEFHENPQGFETNYKLKVVLDYFIFHENPQGFETKRFVWIFTKCKRFHENPQGFET